MAADLRCPGPKDKTHQCILDAALDLFSRLGFKATSTKKIAEKAGVNELTLFRHFGKKDEIFKELINCHSQLASGDLDKIIGVADSGDVVEDLAKVGLSLQKLIEEKMRLLVAASVQFENYPVLSRAFSRAPEMIAVRLKRLAEQRLPGVDSEMFAASFLGLLFRNAFAETYLKGNDFVKGHEKIIRGFVKAMAAASKA